MDMRMKKLWFFSKQDKITTNSAKYGSLILHVEPLTEKIQLIWLSIINLSVKHTVDLGYLFLINNN